MHSLNNTLKTEYKGEKRGGWSNALNARTKAGTRRNLGGLKSASNLAKASKSRNSKSEFALKKSLESKTYFFVKRKKKRGELGNVRIRNVE